MLMPNKVSNLDYVSLYLLVRADITSPYLLSSPGCMKYELKLVCLNIAHGARVILD